MSDGPFKKLVVIDGKGHLLGRLASIVAKQLLSGQRVVIVRCDEIVVSGGLMRNRLKYMQFLRKRTNTNARRGPFHLRAPSLMVSRVIRGMLPHKTPRGQQALKKLRVFEGVPPAFVQKKDWLLLMLLEF